MADYYIDISSSGVTDGTWPRWPFKNWDDVNEHMSELKQGEIINVIGYYEPRTFWEWITRRPKTLMAFVIT